MLLNDLSHQKMHTSLRSRLYEALKYGASELSQKINYQNINDPKTFVHILKILTKEDHPYIFDGFDFRSLKRLIRRVVVADNFSSFQRCSEIWKKRTPGILADTKKPRIGLLVSDGQSIRTFLETDVWGKLNDWADIVILTPNADMEKVFEYLGIQRHNVLPIPVIRKMPIDTLLRFGFYRNNYSPTYRIFTRNLDKNYAETAESERDRKLRLWGLSKRYCNVIDYENFYVYYMSIYGAIHPLNEAKNLLSNLSLAALLNTSSISTVSKIWTRAAALEDIRTISNVISWDNLSTKWLVDEFANLYLLWSDEMKEDFHSGFYQFSDSDIEIVGSPQFEPLINGRGLQKRGDFFLNYGLQTELPLVLYTTGSKTTFPSEPVFLDNILDRWMHHYRNKMQFMIRMHPKDRSARYDGLKKKYPEVAFTYAGKHLSVDHQWIPCSDDIDLLVNQLHHCSVVVNVASTMTIEGFCVGKPSVNIGFDLGVINSVHYPLKDYYCSKHYRSIIQKNAARLAKDYDEVFKHINHYLSHPDVDLDASKKVLIEKCSYVSDSSDRINAAVKKFVLS